MRRAGHRTTSPSTLTRPASIQRSASAREHTPNFDKARARERGPFIEVSGGGGGGPPPPPPPPPPGGGDPPPPPPFFFSLFFSFFLGGGGGGRGVCVAGAGAARPRREPP